MEGVVAGLDREVTGLQTVVKGLKGELVVAECVTKGLQGQLRERLQKREEECKRFEQQLCELSHLNTYSTNV